VTHPGDHGSFGSLLDRDALRSSHGAAADWRGMIGDGTGQLLRKIGVYRIECQELDHRPEEVFDVLSLGLLTTAGVGFFPLGVGVGGSLLFDDVQKHFPIHEAIHGATWGNVFLNVAKVQELTEEGTETSPT
jgi:hypothetical protein